MYKPLNSLIVKPVGAFCNLRCDYCFYLEKHNLYPEERTVSVMPEETAAELIRQTFRHSESPLFIWHGGEPTMAGLPFFKKIVERQKQEAEGRPFQNALQTNGTLLNAEWADFLRKENFLVGISLDGPKEIHDAYRTAVDGRPTHETVENAAVMLKNAGVETNILCTVNNLSVTQPDLLYNYFKNLGFPYMQFIPIVETDKRNPSQAAPFSADPNEFGNFLCRVFDLWYDDIDLKNLKQTTSVRFIDSVFHRYVGKEIPDCILQKECGNYLVVEHNGDCYSCDFLVSAETFLGNLHRNDLFAMLNSPQQQRFGRQKNKHKPRCLQCEWYKLCYGGCPKDRIRDPQTHNHNRFCESYKQFFAYAHQRYLYLAERYLNEM